MGAGIKRHLVHLFILMFFVGCAGTESFKIAEDLSKSKRWDEAIVYFEKAVNENPESQEYKQALENAKQESAKTHYEKAKQTLSAQTDPNMTALEQVFKGGGSGLQARSSKQDDRRFSRGCKPQEERYAIVSEITLQPGGSGHEEGRLAGRHTEAQKDQ